MAEILPLLLAAIGGWGAGITVNYLADILPLTRRLAIPCCLKCDQVQGWGNYLFWPRTCQSCGERRKMRTAMVEILFTAVGIWLYSSADQGWEFFAGLVLLAYLGLVTVIDIEHRLILHSISLTGGILGLVYGTWQHGLIRTLAGGAVGFSVMLSFYFLGFLFIKIQAKRRGTDPPEDALGFGDVNLSGVVGLMLGWPGVLAGLLLTILIAGAVSLIYLLISVVRKRYQANLSIPYGPFIVASTIWLLYLREPLNYFKG